MNDLNRHAARSRILGNLLRKYGCGDASDDSYRVLLEVHDGESVSPVVCVEGRRKQMFRMAGWLAFCNAKLAICTLVECMVACSL